MEISLVLAIMSHLSDMQEALFTQVEFVRTQKFLEKVITTYLPNETELLEKVKNIPFPDNDYINSIKRILLDKRKEIDMEVTTNALDALYWTHPELKEGEVLLINVRFGETWNKPDFISEFRIGEVAYTTGGHEIVPDMKPLFGKLK